MASTETSALAFRNDLMELVKDIVWKDAFTAMRYENPQYSSDVDAYVTAASSLMEHYSTSQLVNMLSYDDTRFKSLVSSLDYSIQRPLWILRNYHEHNNYYRMLAGLPPENLTVYGERADLPYSGYAISINELNLPSIQKTQFQSSTNYGEKIEYLHQLTPDQCFYLETHGYLDEAGINKSNLMSIDKNYRYLDHLTSKRVLPFVARLADRFSLLYSPSTELPALGESFAIQYEASRKYMIQRYYSEAYRNRYEFYEGFIGLAILFMTMQQLNVVYLDTDITRDFFDMDSIKIVYEAYSVPFYPTIPSDYHLKIVKLINRLLAYKGSNHVFFDLAALFDYDKLSIYQYYLMKRQRLNGDGSPHYEYDYTYDYRGVEVDKQINYPASYEFSFVKRTIGGESPYDAVNDENNYVDYNSVINADKYWLDDGDLRDKMYKSEYNYIETKYIGMQMQLSVSEFFYENIFFIRMIMDNRDTFENVKITYSKTGMDIDLFTLVIYAHALIVKKLGWTGEFILHPAKIADDSSVTGVRSIYRDLYNEIPTEPTKIAKIRGFNFKDDIQTIVNEIRITSQRNSIRLTQRVLDDDGNLKDSGNGWYFYPIANHDTSNNTSYGYNSKSLWESMDVEVYVLKDGHLLGKVGTVKNFNCHGIVGGIGTSVTYDTSIIDGQKYIEGNVERGNINEVLERCLYEVVYTDGSDTERHELVRQTMDSYLITIKDASVNLFEGNDNVEMQTFMDLLLDQMDIENAASVNGVISSTINNISTIKKFISDKLTSTKDHNVFMAYRHLYQILMTIEVLPEVIEKKSSPHYDTDNPIYQTDEDGNYVYDSNGDKVIQGYPILDTPNLAVSFEDLLEDINGPLEIHLMGLTSEDDLNDEIDYCLVLLQNLCSDMKYLRSYGTYDAEVIVEYLYKLIKFFKSVKVQLINFKVIYLFDSETDNLLKLMDDLAISLRERMLDDDTFVFSLFDYLEGLYSKGLIKEEMIPKELLVQYLAIVMLKSIVLKDGLYGDKAKIWVECAIDIFDEYKHLESIRLIIDGLHKLHSMLIDYLYYPTKYTECELCINYNSEIHYIIRQTILSDFFAYADELYFAEVAAIVGSLLGMCAKIPYFTKYVDPGHPSQYYLNGYFLYDDRVGELLIDNTTGMGLIGDLEEGASDSVDSYVDITTDESDDISITSDTDSAEVIGLWSIHETQALRFEDKIDLGGTWALMGFETEIKGITSVDYGSTVTFKDSLIQTSFEIQDQFAFGIPVDGVQQVLLSNVTDSDEEILPSGSFETNEGIAE